MGQHPILDRSSTIASVQRGLMRGGTFSVPTSGTCGYLRASSLIDQDGPWGRYGFRLVRLASEDDE